MLVASFCENRNDYIPDKFYDVLPLRCPEETCGYPMVMSETLSNLQCSNDYCPSKIAWRIYKILQQIGVQNITELNVKNYVIKNKIVNVFSIFNYDYTIDGLLDKDLNDFICMELTRKLKENNKFTLKEYVKSARLPYLQDSIDIIFDKVTNLNIFYDNLSTSGYLYISDLLGIENKKSDVVSVRVLKTVDVFKTYKEELLTGLNFIKLED